jgi:hypothetical protein
LLFILKNLLSVFGDDYRCGFCPEYERNMNNEKLLRPAFGRTEKLITGQLLFVVYLLIQAL